MVQFEKLPLANNVSELGLPDKLTSFSTDYNSSSSFFVIVQQLRPVLGPNTFDTLLIFSSEGFSYLNEAFEG